MTILVRVGRSLRSFRACLRGTISNFAPRPSGEFIMTSPITELDMKYFMPTQNRRSDESLSSILYVGISTKSSSEATDRHPVIVHSPPPVIVHLLRTHARSGSFHRFVSRSFGSSNNWRVCGALFRDLVCLLLI